MLSLKNLDVKEVLYTRFVGKYSECKPAWDELMEWATKNNLLTDNTRYLGFAYDNPEIVENCRYDACISAPNGFDKNLLPENIKFQTISMGEYLTLIHKGSYKLLGESYDKIFGDLQDKRYDHTKPCVEHYLNSPMEVVEEELLTEIYVPIL